MPPEPLPFDRKDFLKDRKPSYSDTVGIVPQRWREPATIPSQYHKHGSSLSCRWSGAGGPSDFRRPFSGVPSKRIGVNSGNKENTSSVSMAIDSQKDLKEASSTASPNGNSLPHNDFVNSSVQLQSVDQHAKNIGGGFSTTNSQRLEKDNSLASSIDWKPLKWMRSGSLSSRGSSFSHSSGCKIIGVDPFNPLRSPSEDSATCLTPNTPDDATSRKKARLGWGEGLAKYEKKKVDPDDVLDKDSLTSPSNLSDKSPSVNGYSDCASPPTPYSFACSPSPGLEEKDSTKTVTVNNDTYNPSLSSSLVQTDDSSVSGFVKSTKLQVEKAEVTRTLEITEAEIDALENELKSMVSDESNNKTSEETLPEEKTDSSPEEVNGVEDSGDKSPGTTSEVIAIDTEDLGHDDTCTDSDGEVVDNGAKGDGNFREMMLENKVTANKASDELGRILPTKNVCANTSKAADVSLIKERFGLRKRFLKLKERVITSKFRALHHSWKQDHLHLLSTKKSGARSYKKFDSSSRMGYADHQKQRSSGRGLSVIPTTETLDYVKKLQTDSQVKVQRAALKMPSLILDKSERRMKSFISDNGLVENPVDVEKERSIVSSWSEKDKEIFLEKYSQFGKNFKKIASYLENRTVGECVEFYYKNHKSECFQNAKKNSKFAKGKACNNNIAVNTYLVTSGRKMNSEGATSLEMLGAVTEMVANVDSGEKIATTEEVLNDVDMCSEQETAAADVLAGICGSISSSEAAPPPLKFGVFSHYNVGEGSCSDDDDESCGEEDVYEDEDEDVGHSMWTDEDKVKLIEAVRCEGKDFKKISRVVKTKTADECKVFFSKARKCLGLDVDVDADVIDEGGSEGGDDKSSLECSKMDKLVETNKVELDLEIKSSMENNNTTCREKINGEVISSCPVEEEEEVNNGGIKNVVVSNGLLMPNLFPQSSTGSGADVSSSSTSSRRLSFRKSSDNIMYKRCSNVPKHSLLESPCQILRGFPVTQTQTSSSNLTLSIPIQEEENSSSRGGGDVKLFGQILSKKPKASQQQDHQKQNRVYDVDVKISRIPDSERLLAQYPAAFSKNNPYQFHPTPLNANANALHQPFALVVDKLLSTRKVTSLISDPVSAIGDPWTSNGNGTSGNR